jgi:glucose-6-phosphate 1-dehydrogenase
VSENRGPTESERGTVVKEANVAETPPAAVVIFGASGDLAQRKLAPALHSLACAGRLSPRTRVIGVGRHELDDETFRARLFEGVKAYARLKPDPKLCDLWSRFERNFSYFRTPDMDAADFVRLAEHLRSNDLARETTGNLLFYLATPPTATAAIVQGLGDVGLAGPGVGWRRIVFEKPFGHDLISAQDLNRIVHGVFDESQILRIDHYLGKETVQNILAFRFANAIFEPLWNRDYIDHVQITVAESLGVGHRAEYYDQAGVLRDIVQNHLLQLLTLVALEPPSSSSAKALRDEKVKVLEAARPIEEGDLVLGQYAGYPDEEGVALDSRTPTYAALCLYVDNWRWRGVPFYLRSGKRLAEKKSEVGLQFKDVPHRLFPQGREPTSNRISLQIQPDEGVHLRFETKVPGEGMQTHPVDMVYHYADHFGEVGLPDAYERLLLDALNGDPSLFIRCDEVELSWGLIDPLLRIDVEPIRYPVGTWGPKEADRLFDTSGSHWLNE